MVSILILVFTNSHLYKNLVIIPKNLIDLFSQAGNEKKTQFIRTFPFLILA